LIIHDRPASATPSEPTEKWTGYLVRPTNAQSRDGVRWHAGNALPRKGDAAFAGSLPAGDQTQQRALAGSVRPDYSEHAALLERQTQMADRLHTPKPLGDIIHHQLPASHRPQ
jgi:hypothetical protein